ncbi:LacI family DNA-binding transcriptional regulator [Acidipropionibacterium virtanenii]|uniref:HTH-type transcriptional regulator DegA n=1 Tax=Acidipropionibacterium virtanenii TaxID=2057246 RepID=A0A344UQK8_9ACTN|nr:LacI family DNA-binding transcriptional regulator [Acidipropionibacterium virtanenii]AXE37556.1 HTH-type transcriptional regulator DegA [Acidipropionibacterium virtanenii]
MTSRRSQSRPQSRVTMADVARAAGVSTMTVSHAYNHPDRLAASTLEKVRVAASELRYYGPNPSARSLSRGHTDSIAVVVGEGLLYAFDDPQSGQFLAGVASVCVERRQSLSLLPVAGDVSDAARIRESPADGFILWTGVNDGPLLDAILATDRPVAIQGARPASAGFHEGVHTVTIDDRSAARAVARHVFSGAARPAVLSFALASHQRPTVIVGPGLESIRFPGAHQRLLGFRAACEELGLDWARVPVAVVSTNDRRNARGVVSTLLPRHRPDAVVAMSDQLALAVLDVAGEDGLKVPRELTVSGWDDSSQARSAGLTSVHQNLREQGIQCAELVLGIRDRAAESPWSLALRGSTRRVE